jgi:hypothetical protein
MAMLEQLGVSCGIVAIVASISASQIACDCPSYGPGPVAASGSYTGQMIDSAGTTTPLTGAEPVMLQTQGFAQHFVGGNCSYLDVSFSISVGDGCTLKADTSSSDFDRDSFVQSDATIERGQSCTLMLASGPVTMTVDSGSATIKASSIELSFSGNISAESDAGASTGYLSWESR